MSWKFLDLRTHRVTKLAQNLFQLQPSWSTDGKSRLAYQAGGRRLGDQRSPGAKRRIGEGGWVAALSDAIARVGRTDHSSSAGTVWAGARGRPARLVTGPGRRSRSGATTACTRGRRGRVAGALLVGGAESRRPDVGARRLTARVHARRGGLGCRAGGVVPAHAIARAKPGADDSELAARRERRRLQLARGRDANRSDGTLRAPAASCGARCRRLVVRHDCLRKCARRLSGAHRIEHTHRAVDRRSCLVAGTPRADVIEGTPLWGDVILAGAGNDRMHANDGHTDGSTAARDGTSSGPTAGTGSRSCEIVHR